MKKIGFLFPGQGSQSIGMGKDAADRSEVAAQLFRKADEALHYPLSELCFNGPEDDLKQTQNTQPALYVSSAATLEVLKAAGLQPFAVAGHSLGEYTALHAAGVFDFATGLSLVRTRGLAFAEAGSHRPGAMAAIVGLPIDQVTAICREAGTPTTIVVPANINDPTQIVISGDPPAVEKACELCKSAGAKRALPLPVSGAFHSPLVATAAATMKEALTPLNLSAPSCVFVNNVDADVLTEPDRIKESLVRQVTSSVRWVSCIERMLAEGVEVFVEVGSGKVLSGLARRIAKDAPCYTTENAAAIDKTIAELAG